MRVVLDTNVLVSALMSPYGKPATAMGLVVARSVTPCLDARLAAEYAEVLARPKFGLAPSLVGALLDHVARGAIYVAPAVWPVALPHPADAMLLEIALAADATVVTGNTAHLPEESRRGIVVLTPAEFVEAYRASR